MGCKVKSSGGEIKNVYLIHRDAINWKKTEESMNKGENLLTGGTINKLVIKRKYGKKDRTIYKVK